uniref:Uncharacterized protein n=1 Tax=Ficus carica TaxID=3494 RepID=A0AA87YSE5_FICCA|nr:hypothetical protein TIFTF001_040077 [Ficus carica]
MATARPDGFRPSRSTGFGFAPVACRHAIAKRSAAEITSKALMVMLQSTEDG